MTSTDPLRTGAIEVADRLRGAGFDAYFAGGCVRDDLLGRRPKDYDIVTNAHPKQVAKLFRRAVMVGAAFGVVLVKFSRGRDYEVATYRTDGTYSDGRRPDEVVYSESKEDDVQRRDFTINALLMEPHTGEVLDYVGGRADLAAGLIRAVGVAAERFVEDRLRMLRAVRFAARYSFAIEHETAVAIRAQASCIGDVSAERISGELRGSFATGAAGEVLRMLADLRLLPALFDGLNDSAAQAALLARAARLDALETDDGYGLDELDRWVVILALLMTDGSTDPEGTLRGLKLSRAEVRGALDVLEQASLFAAPAEVGVARRVRALRADGAARSLAFLALTEADDAPSRQLWAQTAADLRTRPLPALPLVTGADLKALGIPPGPVFKTILRAVEDEVFERRLTERDAALAWVEQRYAAR